MIDLDLHGGIYGGKKHIDFLDGKHDYLPCLYSEQIGLTKTIGNINCDFIIGLNYINNDANNPIKALNSDLKTVWEISLRTGQNKDISTTVSKVSNNGEFFISVKRSLSQYTYILHRTSDGQVIKSLIVDSYNYHGEVVEFSRNDDFVYILTARGTSLTDGYNINKIKISDSSLESTWAKGLPSSTVRPLITIDSDSNAIAFVNSTIVKILKDSGAMSTVNFDTVGLMSVTRDIDGYLLSFDTKLVKINDNFQPIFEYIYRNKSTKAMAIVDVASKLVITQDAVLNKQTGEVVAKVGVSTTTSFQNVLNIDDTIFMHDLANGLYVFKTKLK